MTIEHAYPVLRAALAHELSRLNRMDQFDALLSDLHNAYGEPHRHYHTLTHIEALLDLLREELLSAPAFFWATIFHDFVYDPLRPDNEARSAVIAVARMETLGAPSALAQEVSDWILATQTHVAGGDENLSLFLDADMSILASPDREYREYVAGVRQEYAVISEDAWRAGRSAFLASALSAGKVFSTPRFSMREPQAKRNMEWELSQY